jgi:uncharacterized protein YceH (UPF0502 family)
VGTGRDSPGADVGNLIKLDVNARRVFGVLLEKSLAQPSYYPMTLHAILAACNQKSNREPVLELDEDAVWQALEALRQSGLVAKLLPGMAGRVERYKHEAKTVLGWEKPQRAVMAELLLRGPQTLGELRTRCSRMYPFESTAAVAAVLDTLGRTEPPTIAALPRAAGQSAARYGHRLALPGEAASAGIPEAASPASPLPPAATPEPAQAPQGAPAPAMAPGDGSAAARRGQALTAEAHDVFHRRFEELEAEIGELHALIVDLKQRLARLEGSAPEA